MSGVSRSSGGCQTSVAVPGWAAALFASGRRRAVVWRGVALGVLVVLGLLPGLWSMPPVDRDESRFAQASRQMVTEGGWAVPRIGDEPRLNKPPLVYWLQAASVRAFGGAASRGGLFAGESGDWWTGGIGWFRLPSVVCAVIAALVTWGIGRVMWRRSGVAGELGSWFAGLSLGLCVMVLWDGRQARADQLLLACTVVAMLGLWRCWIEAAVGRAGCRWMSAALLWGGLTAGVMAKGPITPMVVGGAVLMIGAATGRWRWALRLKWAAGVGVLVGVVGLWVWVVARSFGIGEYARIVWEEVAVRSGRPAEGHWGPPGYHLVLLPVLFWPGSLFTASGIAWMLSRRSRGGGRGGGRLRRALRGVRSRVVGRGAWGVFLVSWIVPGWLVFEAVSTKLPHYTLPLYPAVALATGRFVGAIVTGEARMSWDGFARLGYIVWGLIGVCVAAGAGVFLTLTLDGPVAWASVMGGVAAVTLAVGVGVLLRRRVAVPVLVAGNAAALLASATVWGVVLPRLDGVWLSSRVAGLIDRSGTGGVSGGNAAGAVPGVSMTGYREDSLVFLTAGIAEPVGLGGVEAWARSHPEGVSVLRVPASWAVAGEGVIGVVRGFNYNGGGWERVAVLRSERAAAEAGRLLAARRERGAGGGGG